MHPAKSVIFFTTASGAGYGLMIWLALLPSFGLLPADFFFGLVALGTGFALIVSGLLSSTLHLGHPERRGGHYRNGAQAGYRAKALLQF